MASIELEQTTTLAEIGGDFVHAGCEHTIPRTFCGILIPPHWRELEEIPITCVVCAECWETCDCCE